MRVCSVWWVVKEVLCLRVCVFGTQEERKGELCGVWERKSSPDVARGWRKCGKRCTLVGEGKTLKGRGSERERERSDNHDRCEKKLLQSKLQLWLFFGLFVCDGLYTTRKREGLRFDLVPNRSSDEFQAKGF